MKTKELKQTLIAFVVIVFIASLICAADYGYERYQESKIEKQEQLENAENQKRISAVEFKIAKADTVIEKSNTLLRLSLNSIDRKDTATFNSYIRLKIAHKAFEDYRENLKYELQVLKGEKQIARDVGKPIPSKKQ